MPWKLSDAAFSSLRQIREIEYPDDELIRLFGRPKRHESWDIGQSWVVENDLGTVCAIYKWEGQKYRRYPGWQVAVCFSPMGEVGFLEMEEIAAGLVDWLEIQLGAMDFS